MAKKLGVQIDKMFLLDQKIKAAEKTVTELKRDRAAMETKLLRDFDKEAIDGCKGSRGVARVAKTSFPSIKDRRRFDKFVLKNKALDLFQNRISAKAYQARLDEGVAVPGIAVYERIRISITKRGKK